MNTYRIRLDDAAAELYRQVAKQSGLPTEQVLADALFRLAGELCLQKTATQRKTVHTRDEKTKEL